MIHPYEYAVKPACSKPQMGSGPGCHETFTGSNVKGLTFEAYSDCRQIHSFPHKPEFQHRIDSSSVAEASWTQTYFQIRDDSCTYVHAISKTQSTIPYSEATLSQSVSGRRQQKPALARLRCGCKGQLRHTDNQRQYYTCDSRQTWCGDLSSHKTILL